MPLKYAKVCNIYANHMNKYANMHFSFSYAKYARICAPHFADGTNWKILYFHVPSCATFICAKKKIKVLNYQLGVSGQLQTIR